MTAVCWMRLYAIKALYALFIFISLEALQCQAYCMTPKDLHVRIDFLIFNIYD